MTQMAYRVRDARMSEMFSGSITRAQPGTMVEIAVQWAYVRDGALFYREVDDPEGTLHIMPMDLLYSVTISGEGKP